MLRRCIMVFPKFENGEIIDNIRKKYDPLASHVKPHITLVFPFESDISSDDLREHILYSVSGISKFEIVLKGIEPVNSFGKYLFLNIEEGRDYIIELHKRLYKGILENYYPQWLKGNTFLPHMTIGCFDNDDDFKKAIDETKDIINSFKTIVNEVCVEIIDENEDSILELVIPLE
ncbi:2'-5' RNA ligase [Caloramator quimbayensis]|uniref:2'-5' RNA ligase n=1 Tax=Caloramator quimbayensis TaxID=1147123 RepID=A0A1T4WE42_9CLOT|nr:2'-5' RNA ligase family protein [Caloramator quimbayensis]SKA75574.1 2'-5' RNA ligase [Caloramator quimbayensis]